MDYFTKNKMLFWCVIVLVILNIATISSIWLKKAPSSKSPAGPGGKPDGQKIMAEQLGLSTEQAEQFEQIRNEHFMRTRPLQRQMHEIRLEILDEMFAAEPDEVIIADLLKELNDSQSQFEECLFTHFQELKDACTPEQTEELEYMLQGLIERTRPRDPEHRRPPGPDGGMSPEHGPPPHRH